MSTVTYPTDTTWQAEVSGPGTYAIASDAGESTSLEVAPGIGPHTIHIEAGGAPVHATLVPGADASGASSTAAAGAVRFSASRGVSGATAAANTGSASVSALVPVSGAAGAFSTSSIEILASDAGHRIRVVAGGAPAYADLVPGVDASGAQSAAAAGAIAIGAQMPVSGATSSAAAVSIGIALGVAGASVTSSAGSVGRSALVPVAGAMATGSTGSIRIFEGAVPPARATHPPPWRPPRGWRTSTRSP